MGNAISGGGGSGGVGSRKTTESARSGVSDLKMTATTGTSAIVNELTRDVERLKTAMDEKDRTIEQLGRAVEDIRVSLISYDRAPAFRLPATMTRTHHSTRDDVIDSMMTIACCW